MIKIICDRCGQEFSQYVNSDVGYVALDYRRGVSGDLKLDNEFEGWLFCTDCIDAIRDFVKNTGPHLSAAEQTEPAQEPAAEPKKKKRRSVDIGKMMALHNAGWGNREIADEMHTTQKAVCSAIWRHKQKLAGQQDNENQEGD